MPTNQEITDLITFTFELLAAQKVIRRRLEALGISKDELDAEIHSEYTKIIQNREVSDLRMLRDPSRLGIAVAAINRL